MKVLKTEEAGDIYQIPAAEQMNQKLITTNKVNLYSPRSFHLDKFFKTFFW